MMIVAGLRATAQPATPDPHAKVRLLLELTGAGNLGTQMIDGMIANFRESMPGVPDEFWTTFRAKIKASDMVEMVIPIYEKHLTPADIDAIIAFYSSPAGKRLVEKQPLILADTMKVGQAWGAKLADEVVTELKNKGYGPRPNP
jgi:hypothetical protein